MIGWAPARKKKGEHSKMEAIHENACFKQFNGGIHVYSNCHRTSSNFVGYPADSVRG